MEFSVENNTNNVIDYYKWDFGDNNMASISHPTHKYAKRGTYTVKLTYKFKNSNKEETITSVITVSNKETPQPDIEPDKGAEPLNPQFKTIFSENSSVILPQ